MGYTTDFNGHFNLTPALNEQQAAYLHKFSEIRHMQRNAEKCSKIKDPIREAVDLPIGDEAEYFVNGSEQQGDKTILSYNNPPKNQPGLWCQWIPTEDGEGIEWDGNEKFYDYIEWIKYLNENFLKPWGIVISGIVSWQGEEAGDIGVIITKDGEIRVKEINPFSIKFEDCDPV